MASGASDLLGEARGEEKAKTAEGVGYPFSAAFVHSKRVRFCFLGSKGRFGEGFPGAETQGVGCFLLEMRAYLVDSLMVRRISEGVLTGT